MTTSIIRAGGTGVPGVQTTGGDDGALALKVGPLAATVEALNISSTGTGAFVGQVTATGFTGTLDGILGSGTPAAATVTTFTSNGIDDNADAVAITIDSSENVGIGTAAPATLLEIAAPASTATVLRLASNKTGSGAGDRCRWDNYSANNSGVAYQLGFIDFDRSDATATASYMAVQTRVAGTVAERMRIDAAGNVGIGTSAPNAALEIKRADGTGVNTNLILTMANGSAEDGVSIEFRGATTTHQMNRIDSILKGADLADMAFMRGNGSNGYTESMRIDSGGNVGIGTTAPAATLDVGTNGTIRTNGLNGGYGNSAGNFHIDAKVGTTGACYINWFAGTSGFRVGNGASGYGAAYASAFTVSSDRRLKENISYFDSGLAQILQLKPATFDFINGENNQKGFIAQDVETVIPEVVGRTTMPDSSGDVDETDEYLTLNQPAIIPYLVAAIKEQQVTIEALTARITTLEG